MRNHEAAPSGLNHPHHRIPRSDVYNVINHDARGILSPVLVPIVLKCGCGRHLKQGAVSVGNERLQNPLRSDFAAKMGEIGAAAGATHSLKNTTHGVLVHGEAVDENHGGHGLRVGRGLGEDDVGVGIGGEEGEGGAKGDGVVDQGQLRWRGWEGGFCQWYSW